MFVSKREAIGVELKGKMWSIYSIMLIHGHPIRPDAGLLPYDSHEIESNLLGMERLGFIFKNPNGTYEIVEEKKLDVLLPYMLEKEKKASLRHVFYLGFLITSIIAFFLYIELLSHESLTNIYLALSYVLFSMIAFMIEVLNGLDLMSFIRKVLEARLKLSN